MEYQKKMEYADKVAEQLQNNVSKEDIKANLAAEGLYERDITNIMASANKVISANYGTLICEYLINERDIYSADAFRSLDRQTIDTLIKSEIQKLAVKERSKITQMVKDGMQRENILKEVDNRFISNEKAAEIVDKHMHVKQQNSGSGRMINIGGGIGLIVLTVIILLASGRLFYVLPIIGLVMIVKGLITQSVE